MRDWRKKKIEEGYGKWLYARRRVVYTNERDFREALLLIAAQDGISAEIAAAALAAAALREAEVEEFKPEEAPDAEAD